MKRLICAVFCLVLITHLYSTDISKIKFEYITVDDGLSQGIIEDILQDSQGFMWFATRDGLNRYDGVDFTVFRNDRNDHNSLVSSYVTALCEDLSGKLWIGSTGLNIYDPTVNKMIRITSDSKDPDGYHGGGRVYQIKSDTDSTIWICTENGLVHYYPSTKKFRTYLPKKDDNGSIGSATIYSICITSHNQIYFGTGDDFIYEYDRKKETFTPIQYKIKYFGNNTNKYIFEDKSGLLYINSEFGGVHVYNPITGESGLLDKTQYGLNALSVKTRVMQIAPDEIWIGTDGGGINIYNPLNKNMTYIMADSRFPGTLSSNAIFKMYRDRDGNVWIGHFGTGISVWKRNTQKFTSYVHNPLINSSINKEVVTAVFEDSKGRIWVGQDGGGLSLLNEETKSFEHFRHQDNNPASLTSDVILTINEDPDGNLLLGTYLGGFMVFNPESRKVIKTFNTENGIPVNHVWMIYKDKSDRYWVTFLGGGYSLYDPVGKKFELIDQNGPVACANVIMHVDEDPQGNIWLGSEREGFCVLNWEKQQIRSYRNDENNPNSLSYNDVKAFLFKDNYAWIATNGGGLNRLDLRTDSFKVYTMSEGLSSNALMGMLEDNHGNFWISSTRGIMKFNPGTEEITLYDKSQGLPGNEFKYNSQCKLHDGRMIFGGVKGLTIFHPDSIKKSNVIPDIVFTDFKVHSVSMKLGDKKSPLKKVINLTDHLKLRHNQSVFTIDFASLDYNSPYKNKFKYILEGLDKNWIDAGNKRSVTYTNIKPGRYTFKLKGSNSDGVWNEEPRILEIRIMPPWYKTKLAILLYLVMATFGVSFYIKQREKKSVQEKLNLEKKIQEAHEELNSKTRKVEEHEKELKRRNEEEKDYRFQIEGVARINEIIAKKRRNIEELAGSIISELVKYLDASAGGIFIIDDTDHEHPILRAAGDFCLSNEIDVRYTFEIGEGNIGACFQDKQTLISDNLPKGYIEMKSGLGSISLHHAVYVPVMEDNICLGVIEVASIEKLGDLKVKFIEKTAESLASIITILKANEKTSRMIEQNNVQAEELKAQEEEMRQNMEELLATQEETQRREKGLLEQMEQKEARIRELEKALAKSK